MNIKINTVLVTCGLALSMAATPTLAQVAPPPTKPASKQPAYTPPPSAPSAAPKPAAKPASQPKNTISGGKRGEGNIPDLPIDVPYPKLAQIGPNGRIIKLRQLPDIAAMRSNPNIGPKTVEKIMVIVYARRNQMELKLIDNLDLYWELTGGLIDNLDMSNINQMGRTAEMLKPLVNEATLSQDLLNRGLLTRVQGGMNQYIVREYKKAITDEIQVLDGDSGLQEVMRFVLDDSVHEARIAYKGLLAEAINKIGSLVESTGASSPEAQALTAFEKELTKEPGQQFEDINEFDVAFRKLSFDEATSIFLAMREGRKFSEVSPTVQTINVLHDRKTVMKGKGFGTIVTDSSGRVVKSTEIEAKQKAAEEAAKAAEKEAGED